MSSSAQTPTNLHVAPTTPGDNNCVLVRFDGQAEGNTSRFYHILNLEDAGKVPNLTDALLAHDFDDGAIHFRLTDGGISVYMDQDRCPEVVDLVFDAARAGHVDVMLSAADLRAMGGPENLQPPALPTFIAKGFEELAPEQVKALLNPSSGPSYEV